jgi:hypothetical protein
MGAYHKGGEILKTDYRYENSCQIDLIKNILDLVMVRVSMVIEHLEGPSNKKTKTALHN